MSKFSLDNQTKVDAGFSFRPISPSAFTRKPVDVTKNPRCEFTVDKPALFQFGNSQSDAEKKFEKKFNFVLNVEKSDESGSGANKNIASIKEMESKSNVDAKLEISKETITEDTNKKSTTQIQDKESSEQKKKSDEGKEKADEEISVKILFKEFKEVINEFSKERAEYEKRITALETRIEALETNRKLEIDNISSTGKGNYGHDTVPMNCAKDMPFAIQPLPVAIPSFISPQATIFGSTPLFSSATAPTSNIVFGATAFPSKSSSIAELPISNRQLNNLPSSLGTPSVVQTNLLSSTENTISKEMKNKSKENSNLLFFDKQIYTDTSFANKGNEVISAPLKVNEGLEKKKQRTSEAPNHLEHQTDQSIERTPSLDNFKKSLEESFQKAMRDIFSELKETLASVYDKKD